MTVLAHSAVESGGLWYPFVALSAPALIVALLTRSDRRAAHRGKRLSRAAQPR